MSNDLIETIISDDEPIRNRSIRALLINLDTESLLRTAGELDNFRRSTDNLYYKVRASLFLFVLYRFYLSESTGMEQHGEIPFNGVKKAFDRKFEEALEIYLQTGVHDSAVCSAIADAYYKLSFQYLLDQVKSSISQCKENYYLYNLHTLDEYPFTVPEELTTPDRESGRYPLGMDASPVRLDPSHSGWSDIFFLGMDFPEGARVVNLSVNLRVHGSEEPLLPPCECYCRFIPDPVIQLISLDLKASKTITSLKELFNFGNDYLSLLKAGVVASGIVPPCFEDKDIQLDDILHTLLNRKGGIEIVTKVNGIPKGSRLAVSTTLLSTIITRLMRFSGQIRNLTGLLDEDERRTVASRAILGEWLGGSGGGWQDSGGLWPGIKIIKGKIAGREDPEFGVSRGCLLPEHHLLTGDEIPREVEHKIHSSMVLVHGGISMDVGPILEMVTEKYLLKHEEQWKARLKGIYLFDKIVDALKAGDMRELGRLTTEDWEEAIQKVIPWVNNAFTEDLVSQVKKEFGENYWGFLMLGGMSGGGMAFIINPRIKEDFTRRISGIMINLKKRYRYSYPFIIDPVVYDFEINHDGIVSRLLKGKDAVIPDVRSHTNAYQRKINESVGQEPDEDVIKMSYGFDRRSHDYLKTLLKDGKIGLARNRLPLSTDIHDVEHGDIMHHRHIGGDNDHYVAGHEALRKKEAAVVTFAGGMGSRWSHGAAVVKPINPFIRIEGRFRSFIESHIAKSRKSGLFAGNTISHVFTTSYLTHDAIVAYMDEHDYFDYEGKIYLSPAKSIGRRVYPMERDLRFYWEEQHQQKMDENIQKVQDDVRRALTEWAKSRGEGEDYSENDPILRFNPPGHWYEIPNLIKNGVLARMINDNPGLKYLLCHNIDTLGAYLDPALLGMHIDGGSCITFEVTPRRIEDAGGGLARINGHVQLIEGMALPREEDEYRLRFYNTLTHWITIDSLLNFFGFDRYTLLEARNNMETQTKIVDALYTIEKRVPTYVTIKNVRHVWGTGQEDIYPVAQFEKLWGDITGMKELKINYVSVPRYRGLQLKEPSLLDLWVNDGSYEYFKNNCSF